MSLLDLPRLLRDVFTPEPNDRVLVMVDLPHGTIADTPDWVDRRAMAEDWRATFREIGVTTLPLLSYPATGSGNADLPAFGEESGIVTPVAAALSRATIAVAMTQYSATAPLSAYAKRLPRFRAASMPGVLRRMERTALCADYREIYRRTHLLAERLTRAERARVTFSTGDECLFDLRHRQGHADDGYCGPDKEGWRVINLPSGEAFIVPYEGERPGEPSETAGILPLSYRGALARLHVRGNRIGEIEGEGPIAELRAYFEVDPARRNVAELGLGCNDQAVVAGSVLEDEKAGMHWAYGRSEHLGGAVGPDAFLRPENVVHRDTVYARGCPIEAVEVTLAYADGTETILRDGSYTVFGSGAPAPA